MTIFGFAHRKLESLSGNLWKPLETFGNLLRSLPQDSFESFNNFCIAPKNAEFLQKNVRFA